MNLSGEVRFDSHEFKELGFLVFARLHEVLYDKKRKLYYVIYFASGGEKLVEIKQYDSSHNLIGTWNTTAYYFGLNRTAEYSLNDDGTKIIMTAQKTTDILTNIRSAYFNIDLSNYTNSGNSFSNSVLNISPIVFPSLGTADQGRGVGMDSNFLYYVNSSNSVVNINVVFLKLNYPAMNLFTSYDTGIKAKVIGGEFNSTSKIYSCIVNIRNTNVIEYWEFNYNTNTLYRSTTNELTIVYDAGDDIQDVQIFFLNVDSNFVRIAYAQNLETNFNIAVFDKQMSLKMKETVALTNSFRYFYDTFISLDNNLMGEIGYYKNSGFFKLRQTQATKDVALISGTVTANVQDKSIALMGTRTTNPIDLFNINISADSVIVDQNNKVSKILELNGNNPIQNNYNNQMLLDYNVDVGHFLKSDGINASFYDCVPAIKSNIEGLLYIIIARQGASGNAYSVLGSSTPNNVLALGAYQNRITQNLSTPAAISSNTYNLRKGGWRTNAVVVRKNLPMTTYIDFGTNVFHSTGLNPANLQAFTITKLGHATLSDSELKAVQIVDISGMTDLQIKEQINTRLTNLVAGTSIPWNNIP